MLSNEKWFGASAGFYPETIDQSLRYNYGDSPYLSRTADSGNRRTFTFSSWFKRSSFNNTNSIFGATLNGSNFFALRFRDTDDSDGGKLQILNYSGSFDMDLRTSQVFRDSTNWYHIVVAVDTTQSTSSDRVKLYVNGSQVTSFSTETYPSQNFETRVSNGHTETVGAEATTYSYIDGYIAEVNFIDGTALAPTSFGELKNSVWIPKSLSSLTYGTNGFRLTFADSSSLGDDTSGNTNDFTSSGLASTDVVLDSPTNSFCTLNTLDKSGGTISEGNLRYDTSVWDMATGTFLLPSGKWYYEVRVDAYDSSANAFSVGIIETSKQRLSGNSYYWSASGWSTSSQGYLYGVNVNGTTEYKISAGSAVSISSHPDIVQGSVIGIFIDLESSTTSIKYNVDGGTPFELFTGMQDTDYTIGVSDYQAQLTFNFGQDSTFAGQETAGGNTDANGKGDFHTALPSSHTDYLALCSSNLPDTTISPNQDTQADDHFDTLIYTGDGTSRDITGLEFQPDWIWQKSRSQTHDHFSVDSSRGIDQLLKISLTSAEQSGGNNFTKAFLSNGVTIGTDGVINNNGSTYVLWNWLGGGTLPTKTYKVVVVSDSGNKYRFRNSLDSATFGSSAVTLDLQEGGTYVFDWSDSTAQGHPIRFSTTSDGTHGGGSEYTTGVVKDDSGYKTTITVASGVATLYYYCQNHSGMGGQINTNTTHGQTNFDGSILSVSQTNETSGFSIVTYTGTGTNGETVGHGLGLAPSVCIIKSRTNSGYEWAYWHKDLTSGAKLYWNSTSAEITGQSMFNNSSGTHTIPTSTLLTLSGSSVANYALVNNSGSNHLAYVFAEIEGYSKFGSFTGNGSTDGTFIYTGFRPAWVLIKQTNSTGSWVMHDNKRSPFNVIDEDLFANLSSAESDNGVDKDFLSNGFKHRASHSAVNGSSSTYIYMAFAEQPFKFSNAR